MILTITILKETYYYKDIGGKKAQEIFKVTTKKKKNRNQHHTAVRFYTNQIKCAIILNCQIILILVVKNLIKSTKLKIVKLRHESLFWLQNSSTSILHGQLTIQGREKTT